jgi:hypothetical protein
MWPGVVAQPVEGAVNGEDFLDLSTARSYSISSFTAHDQGVDNFEVVPPLVVKPDYDEETPAVRTALHAAASDARQGAGRPGVRSKSHYRLFCYTDPTIGHSVAPPSAGWAAGTFPSVCSSFIWRTLRDRGVHFESPNVVASPTDLEPADTAPGVNAAVATGGSPDGLYLYTDTERRHAGELLFESIHHDALDTAGWFGNVLADAADDVANQVLNAFAGDDADGKDSEAWRTTGPASAVSPDNILMWDGPARGGLYGMAEPLQYREPRSEEFVVSRWKLAPTSGTITGVVTLDGVPVKGMRVQTNSQKWANTTADGRYQLDHVPLGPCLVWALGQVEGVTMEQKEKVELQSPSLVVDLALQPSSEKFRLAHLSIGFKGRDDESVAKDELVTGRAIFAMEVGPDKPVNRKVLTPYKWGHEMRAEYTTMVVLDQADNSIEVIVQAFLFEGTSETTDDLAGIRSVSLHVPAEETKSIGLVVLNTIEGVFNDNGQFSITVTNSRNHT